VAEQASFPAGLQVVVAPVVVAVAMVALKETARLGKASLEATLPREVAQAAAVPLRLVLALLDQVEAQGGMERFRASPDPV
jgi:hypothetical protein